MDNEAIRDLVATILLAWSHPALAPELAAEGARRGFIIPDGPLLARILARQSDRFYLTPAGWALRPGVSATSPIQSNYSVDIVHELPPHTSDPGVTRESSDSDLAQVSTHTKEQHITTLLFTPDPGLSNRSVADRYVTKGLSDTDLAHPLNLNRSQSATVSAWYPMIPRLPIQDRRDTVPLSDADLCIATPAAPIDVSAAAASSMLIQQLRLSIRSQNALLRAGIRTIEQLTDISEDKLIAIRNLGVRSLTEIQQALEQYSTDPNSRNPIQADARISEQLPPPPNLTQTLALSGSLSWTLSIDNLELSKRTYHALLNNHILTINQLISLSELELRQLHNIGALAVSEIFEKLQSFWHSLATNSVVEDRSKADRATSVIVPDAVSINLSKLDPARLTVEHLSLTRNQVIEPHLVDAIEDLGIWIGAIPLSAASLDLLYNVPYSRQMTTAQDIIMDYAAFLSAEEPLRKRLFVKAQAVLHEHLLTILPILRLFDSDASSATVSASLRLSDILACLFLALNARQLQILIARLGLRTNQPRTLQDVAVETGVTRERVRQIEVRALKNIKDTTYFTQNQIRTLLINLLEPYLQQLGGVATLAEIVSGVRHDQLTGPLAPIPVLRLLLRETEAFTELIPDVYGLPALSPLREVLPTVQQAIYTRVRDERTQVSYESLCSDITHNLPESLPIATTRLVDLAIAAHPNLVIDDQQLVGLRSWDRKWVDELIRAVRQLGRPSHFSRITESTNALLPLDRQVEEHNVHAMLQRMSEVFVRSGSGKYGLAEWGGPKDRTTSDAAYRILQRTGEPLLMRELTERVLAQRQVRTSSVQVLVTADPRFCRVGSKIALCEWQAAAASEDQHRFPSSISPLPSEPNTPTTKPTSDELAQLIDLLLDDL